MAAELRKGLPIADELLESLRALRPPRGDEAVVDRLLRTVTAQRRRITPLIEAVEAEDTSQIEVLVAELRRLNRRSRRAALDYGLRKRDPGSLPSR